MARDIEFDGWRIALAFAGVGPAGGWFYAAYTGDAFGEPARGMIAAIACAHAGARPPGHGGREAAEVAVHSFAEGYFGARRTFSAKRAAGLALQSINTWLFGQIRADGARQFAPVSLTALIVGGSGMAAGRLGIAHAGFCRLYRRRAGVITPLTRDHVRAAPDGHREPTRAIGLDLEFSADYAEETAEAEDDYLLVSGLTDDAPEAIHAAFALAPAGRNAGAVSAMVLHVVQMPPLDGQARHAGLAALPLRAAPRQGDVWDGFVIGKTIYRGRYTIVKAARDTLENRDVVLKIPLPTMLQDQVFAAGFMREAWIGTTVRGANIARYIDLPDERRSSLYLVLPYYKGETLEARLNRGPVVSLPDGIGIALKLCEAVQDLAAIQIIHRDIKPENIMLLDGNEIKLIDLGLAYLPGIDVQDAVRPGGTIRYMAPELLRGTQANARSEVFALSVTIYRMFSGGAYPFGQREGVPLARLRPDLPGWLGRILQRALADDPAQRFADADEMGTALESALVTGQTDAAHRQTYFPGLTKLRIWQLIAGVFAAGFCILLVRALRK